MFVICGRHLFQSRTYKNKQDAEEWETERSVWRDTVGWRCYMGHSAGSWVSGKACFNHCVNVSSECWGKQHSEREGNSLTQWWNSLLDSGSSNCDTRCNAVVPKLFFFLVRSPFGWRYCGLLHSAVTKDLLQTVHSSNTHTRVHAGQFILPLNNNMLVFPYTIDLL